MEFDKEDPYPCLMIESSDPGIPNADLASSQSILSFLRESGFIGDHKSHSAKEKQTMEELVEDQVAPLMEQVMLSFKAKV